MMYFGGYQKDFCYSKLLFKRVNLGWYLGIINIGWSFKNLEWLIIAMRDIKGAGTDAAFQKED